MVSGMKVDDKTEVKVRRMLIIGSGRGKWVEGYVHRAYPLPPNRICTHM